jgi:hypothetical protein
MKAVRLDPDEIQYCATLEWGELMRYLQNNHGIAFQEQFNLQIRTEVVKKLQLSEDEKESLI